MKICGIYMIEIGQDRYIGGSTNIYHRWTTHRFRLRHDRHSERIQAAFDKHGETGLRYTILEECDANRLSEREKFWIDRLFDESNGLNTYRMETPPKGWRKFVSKSPEHRKKIAETVRARSKNPDYRQNMREKNRQLSPETIKEMYRLRCQGMGVNAIARKLNVSAALVSKQLRGLVNPDLHKIFSEQFYW